MPFPDLQAAFETFFEPTRIWLFGKPFPALTYNRDSMSGWNPAGGGAVEPGAGFDATHANEFAAYDTTAAPAPANDSLTPPRRIDRSLRRRARRVNAAGQPIGNPVAPIFARIYSFSYEGHFYTLPRPQLFLVSDNGFPPQTVGTNGHPDFSTKLVGLGARDWNFSNDILVWAVDKKDLTVSLDIEVGNYQEVLLNSMVAWSKGGAARGELGSRGETSFRGEVGSRGETSFRGEMIGPHHNR